MSQEYEMLVGQLRKIEIELENAKKEVGDLSQVQRVHHVQHVQPVQPVQ